MLAFVLRVRCAEPFFVLVLRTDCWSVLAVVRRTSRPHHKDTSLVFSTRHTPITLIDLVRLRVPDKS